MADKFEEYIAYVGKIEATKDELRKDFERWLENPSLYNQGYFCVRWAEDEKLYNNMSFSAFSESVMRYH